MGMLKNQRHEMFAQGVAAGKTADEAYEAAGYARSRKNASRLRTREDITARVEELRSRVTQGVIITRQWVIERLVENASRAMQATAATDRDGNIVGDYKYDGSVANKALELLGREIGMFVERKEVGQPGDFEKLNADELRDSIARDLAALGREDLASSLIGRSGGAKPQSGGVH